MYRKGGKLNNQSIIAPNGDKVGELNVLEEGFLLKTEGYSESKTVPLHVNIIKADKDKVQVFHERLSHAGFEAMIETVKTTEADIDVQTLRKVGFGPCETCEKVKSVRNKPKDATQREFQPLIGIHLDVMTCKPYGFNGEQYVVQATDNYSRYRQGSPQSLKMNCAKAPLDISNKGVNVRRRTPKWIRLTTEEIATLII